jgi:hypothetical protein
MDVINPYELLGFDSKTPNIEMVELKKQYYMLSLICHPDKGGNSTDMIILKNCYEYIKEQIERKDEKSRDFEEVASEFKEFMKTQSQDPPPFSQVYEEAHLWLAEFNNKFNSLKMSSNDNNQFNQEDEFEIADNDGYGHLMDGNDTDHNINLYPIDKLLDNRNKEINERPKVEFTSEVVVYTEPMSFNHFGIGGNGVSLVRTKVDDFTTAMGSNVLSDYKKAFTSAQPPQVDENENKKDVMSELERIINERKQMDELLLEETSNKHMNYKSKIEKKIVDL